MGRKRITDPAPVQPRRPTTMAPPMSTRAPSTS